MATYSLDSDTIVGYLNDEECRSGGMLEIRKDEMEQIIQYCINEGHKILISEEVMNEIHRKFKFTVKDIDIYYSGLGLDYEILELKDMDYEKAKEFRRMGLHRGDDIHAAFAYNRSATLLSYNKKHFKPVFHLVDVKYVSEVY